MEIRRAAGRFRTRTSWLDSRHSFSHGAHYDPANTHFGLLVASNDDVLAPGGAFEAHPHRDMEIVTWVLEGELAHRDSVGHSGVIRPGVIQRMSAGSGVEHSEGNATSPADPHARPVRVVQMWVLPGRLGGEPGYEQRDVGAALAGGGLVTVASGLPVHAGTAAVALRQPHAALHAARLPAGGRVSLPEAPYVHLYVARGEVHAGDAACGEGDAVRLRDAGAVPVLAGPGGAEILAWQMHRDAVQRLAGGRVP